MPPKKKVKVEEKEKAEEEDSKDQGGEGQAPEAGPSLAGKQMVVGGPEAPRLDLSGEGVEVFEYAPGKEMREALSLKEGMLVRVEIDAKHLTTDNEGIKQRQCWGSDCYTDTSDAVAIAMHTGVYTPTADPPKFNSLILALRVHPAQPSHPASARNGLKTRSVSGQEHGGLTVRVEGSALAKTADDRAKLARVLLRPTRPQCLSVRGNNTLADARILFNLANEPAYKYSLSMVADRAPDARMWTSVKLKTNTLYLETCDGKRVELSFEEGCDNDKPKFRLAEVPKPRSTDKKKIQDLGVPLPASSLQSVKAGLDWNSIEWGVTGFSVQGAAHAVKCCFWLPNTTSEDTA
mmetsp:Transcript_31352/g.78880  ORF Transcript_31352/g.78880 Transcript_31352/m.78880 type:complete len:349 (+) Transcript_31352:113-1159(+)